MHFDFDKNIDNFLKIIVKCALNHKINVYFVGGIVRDNILQKPIKDIDLLIDYDALEFAKLLPDTIQIKSIHKDFHTIKVQYNNQIIDIASTRTEIYPNSACLPVVEKVGIDIQKDYLRRDFTINALYSQLKIKENNLVYDFIDLSNGYQDIQNKILRVLHKKSYIDDPTRILRGVGFKYRFNFDFSKNDKKLIKEYILNPNLEYASKDRIINVFKYSVSSKFGYKIFKNIIKNTYYKLINNNNIECDFKLIRKVLNNFKIGAKEEFYLKIILDEPIKKEEFQNELDIKKYFSKLKDYEIAYYYYKTQDKNALKYLKIKNIKLNINGNDLIKEGYKSGKELGIALDNLLLNKIKNPKKFNNKKEEINWIKRKFFFST